MRVVDEWKWRRAKIILACLLGLAFLACIGGTEGTEPMPNPVLAFYIFPFWIALIWNITKQKP